MQERCGQSCGFCHTTAVPTTMMGTTPGPCHNNDAYMLANGFGNCDYMAKVNFIF